MKSINRSKLIYLIILISVLFLVPPSTHILNAKSNPTPSNEKKEILLWDNWYTVTAGNQKFSYYQEKAIIKNNQINYQVHLWKNEDGHINKEDLGVILENNQTLDPVRFNFFSRNRSIELNINALVSNKIMNATVIQKKQENKLFSKKIPSGTFFSAAFPVWLWKNMSSLKLNEPKSFAVIKEDDIKNEFAINHGIVYLKNPDDFAKKTKSRKFLIRFDYIESNWWMAENGETLKIEWVGSQKIKSQKSTKAQAISFFND